MFELAYQYGGVDPKTIVAQFENSVLEPNARLVLPDEAATQEAVPRRRRCPMGPTRGRTPLEASRTVEELLA